MQDYRAEMTGERGGALAVEGVRPDARLATCDVTPDLIAYVVEKIVQSIGPRQIILFRSRSRGQETASSDLDLFVIQDTGRPNRQVRREIEHLLWGRRFPVDLIVATPEQVDHNVADGNPFYTQHILTEGKVLYERGAMTGRARRWIGGCATPKAI